MTVLKLPRIGNSVGVILPKEVLARLKVEKGGRVFLTEAAEGVLLTPTTRVWRRSSSSGASSCASSATPSTSSRSDRLGLRRPHGARTPPRREPGRARRRTRPARGRAAASALARPRQLVAYGDPPPDLAALAVAYGIGLARNRPFVDGDKRAAFLAVGFCLLLNGQRLAATQAEATAAMVALAAGELERRGFRRLAARADAAAGVARCCERSRGEASATGSRG